MLHVAAGVCHNCRSTHVGLLCGAWGGREDTGPTMDAGARAGCGRGSCAGVGPASGRDVPSGRPEARPAECLSVCITILF